MEGVKGKKVGSCEDGKVCKGWKVRSVEKWKVGKDGRWDVGKFGSWGKLKGN